ncbi:DNA-binding transcriptional regulator, LysR family [Polaromonas sp. OV174]|uniref:LysR family transcriptional regulator n=1 Tax=Polaromonas sp. OV174 TaxID=1855300 RepID=UPI0008F400A7|nr:LysR family transcriptional regulator [Polaromonas sp. OV174]SFC50082.1 DNA-binding transcriptional regulator, LysR family [Polaromonas sp. OV174]
MPSSPDPLTHRLETRLKMRHYALLVAVDKHRSITRVAEQLSLTQPTVTRALADIEDIFMTPLFVRHRRGLEPTPAGIVVLARARLVMADNAALQQELQAVSAGRQGRLRIGVIPYVSTQALNATWQHLFALRPQLALLAHEDTTHNLIQAVRSRMLDCAICRFSHDSTDGDLVQQLLYHQQASLVVAGACADRLKKQAALDIPQLAEMDWIFPPQDTPIRQMINAIFIAAGRTVPIPLIEADAPRTIASALQQLPRGITVLPRDIAQTVADMSGAVVLPQPLPWNLPPVGLAWLRDSPKAAVIAALAAAVRLAA